MNPGSNLCLDNLEREDTDDTQYYLGLYPCGQAPLRTEVRDAAIFLYFQVFNNATSPSICLDILQRSESEKYDLGLYPCHSYDAGSQVGFPFYFWRQL